MSFFLSKSDGGIIKKNDGKILFLNKKEMLNVISEKMFKDIVNNIDNNELEIRFGYFVRNKQKQFFVSDVGQQLYNRLYDRLIQKFNKFEEKETHEEWYGNVRKIKDVRTGQISWKSKRKVKNWDLPDYNVRIALNEERDAKEIINQTYTKLRKKKRTSFTLDVFRIDMTRVIDENEKITFEVEIEYIDKITTKLVNISMMLKEVWIGLYGGYYIYSNNQKRDVIESYNYTVKKKTIYNKRGEPKMNYNFLVQPRNIKYADMVDRGLIGNEKTSYSVTYKADGIRKILFIHKAGIWLLKPPYDVECIYVYTENADNNKKWFGENFLLYTLTTYNGLILDGEVIPKKKRKYLNLIEVQSKIKSQHLPLIDDFLQIDGIKNDPQIWYLIFDVIATPDEGINLSNKNYNERMMAAAEITDLFQGQLLQVNMKSSRNFVTTSEFYGLMDAMLTGREFLPYETDGFIFIPVNVPYDSGSYRIDDIDRVVTKYPDQLKWKPASQLTIDFVVYWNESRDRLYAYVNEGEEVILFAGSRNNPIDQESTRFLDETAKMTENMNDGTIIEYQWSAEKKLMIPIRLRTDKYISNRMGVAINVWDDIVNPITEETLLGLDFKLLRRYHNKIKYSLYSKAVQGLSGPTLLDIGSGRGGDVTKWAKFSKIIAVEPNDEHIKELTKRVWLAGYQDKVKIIQAGGQDTDKIITAIQEFMDGQVDVISFMLSLTFFWQNKELLESLLETIRKSLKPNGKIIFLTMDGQLVRQMFTPIFKTSPYIEKLTFADTQSYIEYFSQSDSPYIKINLKQTIVNEQIEWLVNLDDLLLEYSLIYYQRADNIFFLNSSEKTLTSLYSYGIFSTNPSNTSSTSSKKSEVKYIQNPFSTPFSLDLGPTPIPISAKSIPLPHNISIPPPSNPILDLLPTSYKPPTPSYPPFHQRIIHTRLIRRQLLDTSATEQPSSLSTKSPTDQSTKSPKHQSTKSSTEKSIKSPKEKSIKSPKEKSPKEKSIKSPKEKSPKEKSMKSPKEKSMKSPKEKSMKSPKEKSMKSPKEKSKAKTPK